MVLLEKVKAVFVHPLCQDICRCFRFTQSVQQFRGCPTPFRPVLHKLYQPKKDIWYRFPCKLLLCFPLHQFPTAITETQDELLIGRVPARHIEPCGIGSPAFLFQYKGSVRTPCQPCCPRHFVEHIAVVLLSDVVYKGKTKRCRIKVIAKKRIDPQADMPRLNATSVDIYHVDDALKPYMTVDPAHKTTFQFQVTGTKLEVEKWKVSTESGLTISDDGLLTTVWGPGYGTPYLTSTVTAILENDQRLTAAVRVYAESNFYVDKVLTAFEQKYITSSMTGKEKVEMAAAYIGETTDYQINQNNWQMLLLGGKGDCLASRVLLAYMCKHMGMKAEPCGKFEYHGETLVKVDGTYYIVITGFDEPRPRRYVITEVTDQSQLQKIMDDNNLSPAMFD